MAFYFKRKEPVRKAIRRLAKERIEKALECLRDHGRAEAVHCTRKEIKKVRAVLRLARKNISNKAHRRQTDLLMDAAEQLSATRDAYVKGAALKKLSQHFRGQLAPKALGHIRKKLNADLKEERKRFAQHKNATTVKRRLSRASKELLGFVHLQ